jgi:hypothetical protein
LKVECMGFNQGGGSEILGINHLLALLSASPKGPS